MSTASLIRHFSGRRTARAVAFAQPIEEPSDRERGQHTRDCYATVHEQIGEKERGAAVDIHDRPKAGASCQQGR